MGTYILKRLILMAFTLVLVSFLIFVLIRLAPGRAGQHQSAQGESAEDTGSINEAYVLFKLQNGLHLPLLFNTRYDLDIDDVEEALTAVAGNVSATIPGEDEALMVLRTTGSVLSHLLYSEHYDTIEQLSAPDLSPSRRAELEARLADLPHDPIDQLRPPRPDAADLVDARENLENWAIYAVPALLELAVGLDSAGPLSTLGVPDGCPRSGQVRPSGCPHPNAKVRWEAIKYLSLNAQDRQPDPESGALMAANPELADWTYPLGADDTAVLAIGNQWRGWHLENASRFDFDQADRMRIFFTETGLYTYWSNLLNLDLGMSHQHRKPVTELIFEKWRYSIYLSLLAVFFIYFLSVPIGLYSATRRGGLFDRLGGLVLFLLYSLPSFFVGTLVQDFLTEAREPEQVKSLLSILLTGVCVVFVSIFVTVSAQRRLGRWAARGVGLVGGVLGGWALAQALIVFGAYFLSLTLILAWPLYASMKRWRREKAEVKRSGSAVEVPLPIGQWVGLVIAGCGVTALFVLFRDLFPAPVSGFSSDGIRLETTMWGYFKDVLTHLVLPVGCLTYGALAYLSRYARTGLLDVINSDYIRTARAKGLSEPVVIVKHAVRNGLIPILTLMATTLPALVGGSVVIEYIFDIPGIGNLIYSAALQNDYNVVMGVLLISAIMTLIGVLVSDISYAVVDPRITFD